MGRLINEYTQFNHEVARARYIGADEKGHQLFRTLQKCGNHKQVFSTEVGGRRNSKLEVGDKGELKIICDGDFTSTFLFIPDRKGAQSWN